MGTTRGDAVDAPFDGLLPALIEDLPTVLDEVVRLLQREWPAYAAFLVAERGAVTTAGEVAMRRIVATAAGGVSEGQAVALPDEHGDLELFSQVGRATSRAGERLTALLTAYQVGVRVSWQVIARIAVQRGLPAERVALLAEAVFVFVAELSAASTRGYLEEQSESMADRERARADLVDLLLSDRSDSGLVLETASRAHWAVPTTAAIVLVGGDDAELRRLLSRSDLDGLLVRRPDAVGLVVADPAGPGRRAELEQVFAGAAAVVGPAVSPERLPGSLRTTQIALRLQRERVLVADPVFVDEHLDAVIVHRDRALHDVLREQVLAPMSQLAPDTRQRLEETLSSWLRHMGDRQKVAAELYVHRQTVRYRLGQLVELFGPALEDPSFRVKLVLALAWQPSVGRD